MVPAVTPLTPSQPAPLMPAVRVPGLTDRPREFRRRASAHGTADAGASARDGPTPELTRPAAPEAGRRSAAPKSEADAPSPMFVWLKEVATVVVIAVVLSFLIKTFLFRAFYIPSESMVSTLDVNDRIFVNLLVPEPFALSRGDVVVFRDTQGWLAEAPEEGDRALYVGPGRPDVRGTASGQLRTAPRQTGHRPPRGPRDLLRRRR